MERRTGSEDTQYLKDGRCCDRCPAGSYVQAHCNDKGPTRCAECQPGFYTATDNHLDNCQDCRVCSSDNNQKNASVCTTTDNTVCECETGFYCSNRQCDHCQPAARCPAGQGVKVPATGASDTVCVPCADGTYSNVTDFLSPCWKHTRCGDSGRRQKTSGSDKSDAVCEDSLSPCSWLLPAGLWSGLVLTSLVLFVLVLCWRAKRKSYRPGKSAVPINPANGEAPTTVPSSLDLPFPSTELTCQWPESFKLPLFHPEEDEDIYSGDKESGHPITPLKTSVSFVRSSPNARYAGYCPGNFRRAYSEPQEDEWCGAT